MTDLDSMHSVLNPAGPGAANISGLFMTFLWTSVVVYAATMGFLVQGVARARRRARERPGGEFNPETERRMGKAVAGAVAVTVLVLFGLLVSDFAAGRDLREIEGDQDPLELKVTGHQWWWEVEYRDAIPSNIFKTANEIHVPAGRAVRLELASADVIHSFWAPSLMGKRDLIPGRGSWLWLRADKPGVYGGQCAEFCGQEHAKMRFTIVADEPADFAAWLAAQRAPAPEPEPGPGGESVRRGRDVFLGASCAMCHAVSGTKAGGAMGPDLTHLAGRRTLGAGSADNQRAALAGWILDPHGIKPGVDMPRNVFEPVDLRALLDFLESLK